MEKRKRGDRDFESMAPSDWSYHPGQDLDVRPPASKKSKAAFSGARKTYRLADAYLKHEPIALAPDEAPNYYAEPLEPSASDLSQFVRASSIAVPETRAESGSERAVQIQRLLNLDKIPNERFTRCVCLLHAFDDAGFRMLVASRAYCLLELYLRHLLPWGHVGLGAKPTDIPLNSESLDGTWVGLGGCLPLFGSKYVQFTWYCQLCRKNHRHRLNSTWVVKLGAGDMTFAEWAGLIHSHSGFLRNQQRDSRELSHLCGNAECHNPGCLVVEPGAANNARRKCHQLKTCVCGAAKKCMPEGRGPTEIEKQRRIYANRVSLRRHPGRSAYWGHCTHDSCDWRIDAVQVTRLSPVTLAQRYFVHLTKAHPALLRIPAAVTESQEALSQIPSQLIVLSDEAGDEE
ncbi:hypothetical protein BCR34DRAFT_160477 [Clohesyomyces aquaticus]|uniref:Zinc-binding loop region of homing endonuclease domain-containing protein n=1 Tax=Clohesyomyces aquaticus TaxID=1231657 RepID=A0A1Y1YII5_9PLEO|nr:hypothetical protein BCR34DRAFT_160477 [Clohesyomyces aquaticus]